MTLAVGDKAMVTGPLKLEGEAPGGVYLDHGDLVTVHISADFEGDVLVSRDSDLRLQFIAESSLTPVEAK